MKKILLLTVGLLISISSIAQESLGKGNTAMQNKQYAEAVKQYEAYFKEDATRYTSDTKTVYNLATAAYKAKQYDKAITYCDKCVEGNYKADMAAYMKALTYRAKKDDGAYEKALSHCMEKYPESSVASKSKGLLTKIYNKEAAAVYNVGNQIAGSASSDPATYVATMEKAIKKYDEAVVIFQKTLKLSPNDSTAKNALASIESAKKNLEAYKAQLK